MTQITPNPTKFGGIECKTTMPCAFNDLFEVVSSFDGQMYAETKKTYFQDDKDLSFHYKYVIEVIDMRAYGCDGDKNLYFALHLMVSPESLNDNLRKSMEDSIGLPLEQANAMDIVGYGGCTVKMADEAISLDADDLCCPEENATVQQMLNTIASVVPGIDCLRGFYIDRPWNMIGSTGWDTIKHCIKGADLFQPAFDRYKQSVNA